MPYVIMIAVALKTLPDNAMFGNNVEKQEEINRKNSIFNT